jgi:hypothetical protein
VLDELQSVFVFSEFATLKQKVVTKQDKTRGVYC